MSRFVYVALSDPLPGREADLNRWYEEQHLADVLAVPGFVSAQRFEAVEAGDGPPQRRRILVLYEIEADDPAEVVAALRSRRGTDRLVASDALDAKAMFAQVYAPVGQKRTPRGGQP